MERVRECRPTEMALLLCDMWDDHWCRSAARRCGEIAARMEPVVAAARRAGVTIIHAPSDCMDFYADWPQRRAMEPFRDTELPADLPLDEPPLPIDDSDAGCDDEPSCPIRSAWTRQHPALTIAPDDFITESGRETVGLLRSRGISSLTIAGVHTNMCVVGRSFGIRQMKRWGFTPLLARDLTDALYNPRMAPFVSHAEGTELVIAHIERWLCPSISGSDLIPAG